MEKVKIYTEARFKPKSDTLKNWQSQNPILLSGEPGVVIGLNEAGDGLITENEKIKFGDGVTPWNDLPWWKGPKGDTGERGPEGDGIGRVTEEGGEIFNAYEGEDLNKALGAGAHAEGRQTIAAKNAHAEGRSTQANGNASHAEGNHTVANGNMGAHAEGRETYADGEAAHSEGAWNYAVGDYSHSQGMGTKAIAISSHASGKESFAGTNAFEIKDINFKGITANTEEQEPTGQVVSYYVKANESEEQDGSQEYPFNTIAQAIALGITAGLTEGDTLIVNLLGDITWADGASHDFKVIVQSSDDIQKTISFTSTSAFKGDMEFKNINLKGASALRFSGNNIKFDKNSILGVWYISYGIFNTGVESEGQTIVLENDLSSFEVGLQNSYDSITYNGDVTTIIENCTRDELKFFIGDTNNAKATYKKNINFDIRNANKINLLIDYYNKGLKLEGALQIINSSIAPLTCETGSLSKIPSEKKWILTNKSTCKDVLSFTEETGKFAVKEGYVATAYNLDGVQILSENNLLDLSADAGEYTVTIREAVTYEGTIVLSSVEGLQDGMQISIKSTTNQDFILNAGEITAIDYEGCAITVMGYPSQINKFLSAGKKYVFILADCMLGDSVLGDSGSANGIRTKTIGKGAHTDGEGTIATADFQYVCGRYNVNKPDTVFELGCGSSDTERRNAFEVYKDGTIGIYGTKITRERLRKLLELIN